jgi:RNA 2',3'-cyclic 3'-phosphodiesterase
VSAAASVEGRDRLRLFCALTLPEDVLDALVRWQQDELRCDARSLPRDHLHVTLAFLGSRPTEEVEPVTRELRAAAKSVSEPLVLTPARYRETRSVAMLVLDDAQGRTGALASDLHGRLQRLGVYEPERRSWLPHVTVLRFRRQPRLRPQIPDLGPFSPSGAAVYHSLLRPGGAQYDILDSVALGG